MKKIIVTVLSLFVIVGIALASYLCVQRNALDEKLITILKQEIAREYPDIGYSFTCSLDGTLLSHPLLNEMPIKKLSEMFDASEEKRITTILTDLKTQKELLIHDIKDPRENSVELFMLKADDTLHGLIFFPAELKKFVVEQERHILILLSLCILLAICCFILILGTLFFTNPKLWWYIVTLISFAMMANIYYLWSLHRSVGFQENLKTMPILSKSQELYFFKKLQEKTHQKFTTIPTGVFIEHAQFTQQGADIHPGVFLRGYIWQRYNTKEHANLDRDVVFTNAYSSIKQELSRQTLRDEETICWLFSCNLYETFNARLYPFDHRHIVLNLLHKNFEKNIALVPDLSSYEVINSILLPGISPKIALLSHWHLTKSYYNFELHNFKTSLGFPEFSFSQMPYLQFIIDAQRRPGGSFIMHFVLLFVVLTTLFILLMAFLKQETLIDIVGFSTLSVIGVCSALLFVLITSEINLRQLLMTEGMVYLEYIYLISYFIIIGVVINSIVFAVRGDLQFFVYQNNLIFKLCYWPTVFLSIIIATAYLFY